MRTVVATVLVAVTLAGAPRSARAQMEIINPFIPDTTLQRTDKIPPLPPMIRVSWIGRGRGLFHYDGGTVGQLVPEGPTGWVNLALSASDGSKLDYQTQGFRFHVVDGKLPGHFPKFTGEAWPGHPGASDSWISFGWEDGQSWKQEPFSFRMYVTAVDRAGNESKPSNIVEVSDAGDNEAAWASEENRSVGTYAKRVDPLQGNWSGKDVGGKHAMLSISRHHFKLVLNDGTIEGFAQVWNDEDGTPHMAVDTGELLELTGPFELKGNRLKLWLQRPGETRYYDLRKQR